VVLAYAHYHDWHPWLTQLTERQQLLPAVNMSQNSRRKLHLCVGRTRRRGYRLQLGPIRYTPPCLRSQGRLRLHLVLIKPTMRLIPLSQVTLHVVR
jgi:hypothetical protein